MLLVLIALGWCAAAAALALLLGAVLALGKD